MDTLKKSQIVAPTVESTRSPFTGNSQGNEMAYFVENFLNGRVNTALPCKVQAVYSDGISVAFYSDPPEVSGMDDMILTVEIKAPSEIEIAPLSITNRLRGFLPGELYTAFREKGSYSYFLTRIRVTPSLEKAGIKPLCVEYSKPGMPETEKKSFATLAVDVPSEIFSNPPLLIFPPQDKLSDPGSFVTAVFYVSVILVIVFILALSLRRWRLAPSLTLSSDLTPEEKVRIMIADIIDSIPPDSKYFYLELARLLRIYIKRKLDIPSETMTRSELLSAVKKSNSSPEIITAIGELLKIMNDAEFSREKPSEKVCDITLEKFMKLLSLMDNSPLNERSSEK